MARAPRRLKGPQRKAECLLTNLKNLKALRWCSHRLKMTTRPSARDKDEPEEGAETVLPSIETDDEPPWQDKDEPEEGAETVLPSTETDDATHEIQSLLSSSLTIFSKTPSLDPPYGIDLDDIIDRLLGMRSDTPGTEDPLLETEIHYLCKKSKEIFLSQPVLLELSAPLAVIGDIRGQYYDLFAMFELRGFPPEIDYLFLGNYVDLVPQSIETVCLLLAYKIKYPNNIFLLRGSHECVDMTKTCGFYAECESRHNKALWAYFVEVFICLPVAAIVEDKIFCCHGGLSPHLEELQQIRDIRRPTMIPKPSILFDLLWSDPDEDIKGWYETDGADNLGFGPDVVSEFLEKHGMTLVVRSHQAVRDGHKFFANWQLVTV
ncbi:Metallo-dependent phosphatase-like protein [Podospora aff. communis PSN243]|uniref:protein-serine/threonine phosphatase n=1 Tax=Podospora aff. communis PSN243 TaxID=3040156 RepID=A0AAV9GC71_9PEZI|nr:Metallo-dependent phosphatase-like protein [Podospora aff. communis PSN243]